MVVDKRGRVRRSRRCATRQILHNLEDEELCLVRSCVRKTLDQEDHSQWAENWELRMICLRWVASCPATGSDRGSRRLGEPKTPWRPAALKQPVLR